MPERQLPGSPCATRHGFSYERRLEAIVAIELDALGVFLERSAEQVERIASAHRPMHGF
jgi:hypothetical protein